MAKILVTGAAGFIGSNFVRMYLNDKAYTDKIIALDALTYAGNLANLTDFESNKRLTFIKGDICDIELIDDIMSDIDIVIHFAAESHVDRSIISSNDFIRTNIIGTQVLADAARKYKISRFQHVSTDEVYGSLGKTGLFTESTPFAPNSPYAASKASSDLIMLAYHRTHSFPVVITNCSNNYGRFQFPEKLIPLFVTNLIEGKKVSVYGDGMQIRDWLHVDDHCRAIMAVLDKGREGEVYNIGGNNEQENISITKMIIAHLDKEESSIVYVEDRLGHDRRYAIDTTKIKDEIGWEPEVNFQEGMVDTINWYVNNIQWWQNIKSGSYMDYYEKQYINRTKHLPNG
jgi:dTDP-glucose 4,6-dehydratase